MGSFGLNLSESELRTRCDCTPLYGTDALMAVDAIRALGFPGTAKYTLWFDELKTLVIDGHYPIACVDLNPIDGVDDIHAMVVIRANCAWLYGVQSTDFSRAFLSATINTRLKSVL